MIEHLKFGIIGLSQGNGHPYSWSAIINGYDVRSIEACGFPSIPRYLGKEKFPEAKINQAKVTYVWTQDKDLSRHIAKSCYIDHIADSPNHMIGKVDAILLARDDAENHYELAKPFLDAGLPIYIDKPLAFTVCEAVKLLDAQKYSGQIFTCSALKYANEFKLSKSDHLSIGKIINISAKVPKSWKHYAIHVIEPILNIINDKSSIFDSKINYQGKATILNICWNNGMTTTISASGDINGSISIDIEGEQEIISMIFVDTFNAFKSALNEFIQGILHKDIRSDRDFILKSIKIVELGNRI